jgi:hypothetical protein
MFTVLFVVDKPEVLIQDRGKRNAPKTGGARQLGGSHDLQ